MPGGDYGFAWMPHGTNANDLQYLVDYVGMTPAEALRAATKFGGEIMQRPTELGQLRPGFLADLVLVDGNPLKNLALLTDPAKVQPVMKDGRDPQRLFDPGRKRQLRICRLQTGHYKRKG